jgi:hypothetical protein
MVRTVSGRFFISGRFPDSLIFFVKNPLTGICTFVKKAPQMVYNRFTTTNKKEGFYEI